jgi:rhodanese-related sulfurtransferase
MDEPIRVISADDLKAKLEHGASFRLVDALPEWEFRRAHIPRSERFDTLGDALAALEPDEEIVVYCTDPPCHASQKLYKDLVERGYVNVRRFEGGLVEWAEKGYPLEGDAP